MPWKLKINGTFFIALIFLILSLFLVIAVTSRFQEYSRVFQPSKGHLELRESDFQYSILLSGEWEYYDRQLLTLPDEAAGAPEYVMVPHVWNGMGYGSYRLLLKGMNPEQCYSLYVPDMGGAYRLYIDGEERGSNGVVATDKASERLHWEPGIITFRSGDDSVEIVLQVSNYHSFPGGFLREMKLGRPQVIQHERNRKLCGDMVVLGGLLIIALYNLCLFILNPSNRSTLFFTLFNLSVCLRMAITGERIVNLLYSGLDWRLLYGMLFVTGTLMLGLFILFMNSLFKAEFHRWIVRVFLSLTLALLAAVFFLPVSLLGAADSFYFFLTISFFLYLLFVLVRAVRVRRPGAVYTFIGIAFLLGIILTDTTLPPGADIVPLGIFIFTVFQSLVIAERYSLVAAQNRTLHHVAVRDEMTGLFKKRHFQKLIGESLDKSVGNEQHGMMFIDMDNFKQVNDSYGHDTGDELIITVARALQRALRSSDKACRYGGDEFVIWLEDAEHEEAEAVAGRILRQIAEPVSINGHSFSQSVSIGLSFYPGDAGNFDGLMEVCDRRMYLAKRRGKNRFMSRD